jgi:hypothetical protein
MLHLPEKHLLVGGAFDPVQIEAGWFKKHVVRGSSPPHRMHDSAPQTPTAFPQ